jgi:tetratricopeptide (TPR) repeat protein
VARSAGKTASGRKGSERIRKLYAEALEAVRAGDLDTGRRLLKQADGMAPGNPAILFNLGYVHHLAGQYDQAVGFYRRCLDRQPTLFEGWVNLVGAAREAGQYEIAIKACAEILRQRPDDAAIRNDLANLLVSTRDPAAALEHYRRALALDPGMPGVRRNLASALRLLGRVAEAETELGAVLEADPRDIEARMMLVGLLDEQNRVDEAERLLSAKPGGLTSVDEHLLAGNLLMRQGLGARAESHYHCALERRPDHPMALNNLGLVHVMRSDTTEAERLFRRVIETAPAFTDAWRNLTALRRYKTLEDPDIEAMRNQAGRNDLSDEARLHLGFALGKALDDCGAYDEAFDFYQQANALRRQQTSFDLKALEQHALRIRSTFDREFFRDRPGWGSTSMLPVYIVGMPRTGTTLLEQILSAHAAFHGAGELLLINRLIARLERPGGTDNVYPEGVNRLDPETVAEMAAGYLDELRGFSPNGEVTRIGDKMPYNFFHLGLIHLLFPKARIIHCNRNPVDTCLSAYFNYFPRGMDFTYSLDDLPAFFRIYGEIMTHWREQAGIDYLEVRYEDVVTSPEQTIRGVLDYIGLPWDPQVLHFHSSRREVSTLSAWQVRQPLHGASRERWKHYEARIGPLIQGLSRVVGETPQA